VGSQITSRNQAEVIVANIFGGHGFTNDVVNESGHDLEFVSKETIVLICGVEDRLEANLKVIWEKAVVLGIVKDKVSARAK